MRDIARTMGVSLGLCYRYFDSKQILFNTAIDLYIEECCNSYLAILHDSTITIKDKIDALFTSIGDEHSNMQYYDFFIVLKMKNYMNNYQSNYANICIHIY